MPHLTNIILDCYYVLTYPHTCVCVLDRRIDIRHAVKTLNSSLGFHSKSSEIKELLVCTHVNSFLCDDVSLYMCVHY